MASKKDVKKTKVIDIWKKKRWYPIVAPKMFGSAVLGETPSLEQEQIQGRCITTNLGMLMRDSKKQGMNITFEIDGIAEGKAVTKIKKIVMVPSSIKRLVRRKQERIDDSFLVTTNDNIIVRIKPFFLTRNECSNSVCTALRLRAREILDAYSKTVNFDTFLQDILSKKIFKELKGNLDKLFPLKICELRVIERVSQDTKIPEKVESAPVARVPANEEEVSDDESAFEEVAEE